MEFAYKSEAPAVLDTWRQFIEASNEVAVWRNELSDTIGRHLMVNRSGFGHGTRVTGFERFEGDQDGDLIHHGGCLIVSSKRGSRGGIVIPNLKRKAGKEFAAELEKLTSPQLDLPGMPQFHIGGDGDSIGLRSFAPELWEHQGAIWARWGCNLGDSVGSEWSSIPLSQYWMARETFVVDKELGQDED